MSGGSCKYIQIRTEYFTEEFEHQLVNALGGLLLHSERCMKCRVARKLPARMRAGMHTTSAECGLDR